MVGDLGPHDLPMSGPGNPMGVARELIEEQTQDGMATLRRWRGGWLRYQGTHWAEVEDAAMAAELYTRLEHATYLNVKETMKLGKVEEIKPWLPTRAKVSNVVDALAAVTHLPESVSPPCWAGDSASQAPDGQLVALANGLLDVVTGELHPHTPAYFNQIAVPFDYDPDAADPTEWLKFLGQLWPDDPESIKTLQEWLGYVLSGRTDLHKILLMLGPKRSGKGTIARILEKLVGAGNHTNPTFSSLASQFGLAALIGKPLATIADARLSVKADASVVVERLLSISGGDGQTIDRKYLTTWSGRLPTRIMILSNEMPRLSDPSGAMTSRFVVVSMTESFAGKEDLALEGRLTAELPGILNWALEGLRRLTEQGRFTVASASEDDDEIDMLGDLISPVSAFVDEKCETPGEVPRDQLFAIWRLWATDNGHHAGSVHTFGRDLRAVLPSLRTRQRGTGAGRYRVYVGIRPRGWAVQTQENGAGTHTGTPSQTEVGAPPDLRGTQATQADTPFSSTYMEHSESSKWTLSKNPKKDKQCEKQGVLPVCVCLPQVRGLPPSANGEMPVSLTERDDAPTMSGSLTPEQRRLLALMRGVPFTPSPNGVHP